MNLRVSLKRETEELLNQPNVRLRIGDHVVDVGALRVLTRPDQPRLTSKAMAVLLELVRQAGDTVTRDQLLDSVWKGRCPTPDVLNQAIKELRRAFADDAKPSRYVETIPKVGYRLVAQVLFLHGPDGSLLVDGGLAATSHAGIDADADADAMPMRRARPWLRRLVVLAGVIAVIAIVGLALVDFVPRKGAAQDWKVTAARVLTSDPGSEIRPHISPDGTRIAYGVVDPQTGFDRILVRSMQASQRVQLTAAATNQHEAMPVWSPDGARIAFERIVDKGCDMYVASSLGGGERKIGGCRDYNVNYFDWTLDGRGLLTAATPPGGGGDLALLRWDLETGKQDFLDYPRKPGDEDLEPRYSPDGRWISFRRGVAPYSDLFVMPVGGGEPRQLTHLAARIRGYSWLRDSSALVLSSDYAGEPALYTVELRSGALHPLGVVPAEYPDSARVADDVVYEIPRTHSQLTQVALDPAGAKKQTFASSTGSDSAAALSSDGARIAFVSDRGGQMQLWMHERATNATTALTDKIDTGFASPRWNRDGTRVVAVERDTAGRRLIEVDIATRRVRVLSRPDENVLFGLPGADPDSYVFAVGLSARDNQLFLLSHADSPGAARHLLASGVAHAEIDLDARSVYYTATAKKGLYRRALEGGDEQFVTPNVDPVSMDGWRLVAGRVWYLSGPSSKPTLLNEVDPATGAERVIASLDLVLRDVNFSVTPARDALIVTPSGADDTDIGTFRLVRDPAH
jgi:Tol biopolymer transport system component/DNA-binding winged helix-turn-helix (wHTH) protein